MKIRFIGTLIWILILMTGPAFAEGPVIKIVQPYENNNIPFVESSFVFGSVEPATSSLTINGTKVNPHTNGGFITMIPFKPGPFKIEAVATDGISTTTVTRSCVVAEPLRSFPENSNAIDSISPKNRVVLRPGELLTVSFQAAPNSTASFRIGNHTEPIIMLEQPSAIKGFYKGVYRIQPTDRFDKDDLLLTVKRADEFGQFLV